MARPMTWARIRRGLSRVRANLRARVRHLVLAINPSAFTVRGTGSPADFSSWVERASARRSGSFPDSWRTRMDLPLVSPARVAVVLHVYYVELLDEIIGQLAAIPVTFDLIVTNASGSPLTIEQGRLPKMANLRVLEVENHGRDILPLVQLVNAGLLDPYHVALKVHTKRSEWRDGHQLEGTGADWRKRLLDDLLGDVATVTSILNAFATSPSIGLVTADGSLLGPEYWGGNQAVTAELLRRIELDLPTEFRFAAGSIYWIRGFVLQGLRALGLSEEDFESEAGQVNATTAHAIERLIGLVTEEAGLTLVERHELHEVTEADTDWKRFEIDHPIRPRVRVVPFYLPQFHPIPENDRWWGAGFTEWANVVAGRPVYPGHDQPKMPADLGFYDLRMPEAVARQVALAEMAGIEGFMYYHYWFADKQLLEKPIQDRLRGTIQLPFCLMWANENWTRRWDGRESDVLMGQDYEDAPAARFIEAVMPILQDRRYMRIDSRAIVAIYRPGQIPDLDGVIEAWRKAAKDAGVGELFVMNVDVAKEFHGIDNDTRLACLDGCLGFPPHNALWEWVSQQHVGAPPGFAGNILSYRAMANDAIHRLYTELADDYYPGVMVGFDNTSRRQTNPDIWYGSNPYTFRRWLAATATAVAHRDPDHRLIFVNAWNEWAEAAVLEPSARWGSTFLLAVGDVTRG